MRTCIGGLLLLAMFACTSKQNVITVEAKGLNVDKLYLCEVISEYRGIHQVVDSIVPKDGKFVFTLKEGITPELISSEIPRGMAVISFWMVMI